MDDGGEETETTPEADNKSQEDSMTEDEILKKYFEAWPDAIATNQNDLWIQNSCEDAVTYKHKRTVA